MGYTHYWRRKGDIDLETFRKIESDFRIMIPVLASYGIILAGGSGSGNPVVDDRMIAFNGATDCGHEKNSEISIPWPAKGAKGVMNGGGVSGRWFAGAEIDTRICNGDCSYETFCLVREFEKGSFKSSDGLFFDCTKTAYRPYDLAVTVCLVIAKNYLKDDIYVSSDGEMELWADALMLCEEHLGYGRDFELGRD